MCTVHCAFLSLLYTFLFGSPWCYTKSLSTFLWVSSPKTIFTPDWSCLMLVHKAYVGYRKFPAEKQKKKKKKKVGEGVEFLLSHPTLIQTHQFTSLQTPTHSYNPPIHPLHIHTHTLTPYTHTHPSIHPHTQPQDSIHMHMHRLLVPYIQAVRVMCFEFMSLELFPQFSGLWWQAFDFLYSCAS